jgi:hypothetical protein
MLHEISVGALGRQQNAERRQSDDAGEESKNRGSITAQMRK